MVWVPAPVEKFRFTPAPPQPPFYLCELTSPDRAGDSLINRKNVNESLPPYPAALHPRDVEAIVRENAAGAAAPARLDDVLEAVAAEVATIAANLPAGEVSREPPLRHDAPDPLPGHEEENLHHIAGLFVR